MKKNKKLCPNTVSGRHHFSVDRKKRIKLADYPDYGTSYYAEVCEACGIFDDREGVNKK